MKKRLKRYAVAAVILGLAGAAHATLIDITELPGYGVATSMEFNFNGSGGWAGWSVPAGKVVLGAEIISAGDSISDFSVFRPAGPNEVFPHYTYGADEYGFVIQDNGLGANSGVQIEVYYADPVAGYTITKSFDFNYSATGWAGWSAPTGQFVTGGGYQFETSGAYPQVSEAADGGSVYPHYTFGPDEQGWVVQSGAVGGPANAYVISIPEPASLGLIGLVSSGIFFSRRFFRV